MKKNQYLKKKIKYSYVFVFKIDEYNQIVETKVYNTKNIKNIKFADDKTSNEIIKRGLLEKIFGGVGTQQELPTTPWFIFIVILQLKAKEQQYLLF